VGSTEQQLREATGISSFRLDAANSDVRFNVMKMGFWPVRGRIRSMEGRLEFDAEGRPVAAELPDRRGEPERADAAAGRPSAVAPVTRRQALSRDPFRGARVQPATTLDRPDFGIRPPRPFELIVGDLAALELELVLGARAERLIPKAAVGLRSAAVAHNKALSD
jgi:hypothetical protein